MNDSSYRLLGQAFSEIMDRSAVHLAQSAKNLGHYQVTKGHLEAAVTSILLEIALCDLEFDINEANVIMVGLQRLLGANPEEISRIIQRARATKTYPRANEQQRALLRTHLSLEQRQAIMQLVDSVIMADGKIDGHEMYFRFRIAKALEVEVGPLYSGPREQPLALNDSSAPEILSSEERDHER